MDYSPPGFSVHGILQARILEWVAIPFSRGSSPPRGQTWVSCIAGRFSTIWATRQAPEMQIKCFFFFSNSCIILYWFIYCFSQSFFREEERMLVKVVGRSLAERKDLPLSHPSPEASLPSPWRRSRFRPGTIIYNPCPSKGSRNLASRGAYPCEAYPSV